MPTMTISLLLLWLGTCCLATDTATLGGLVDQSVAAGDKVKVFVKTSLLPLLSDPVMVRETVAQNGKRVPLEQIKLDDEAWQKAAAELPLQRTCLTNACAMQIKALVKDLTAVRECFVMDDQGANVGQNALTSDYWQGDEDKWQKSFNHGKGGIDVGKLKFDKSANANLQQISLPLFGADGVVVGAVTFGIDVDRL